MRITSLRLRMMVFFTVLLLATSSLIGFIFLNSSERLVQQSIGLQAKEIAGHAVKEIDTEKYKSISPESGENAYYTELRTKLNEIREANGLKYLYTMAKRETGGKTEYVYIVDGMPLDSAADGFSPLGQAEPEPTELLIRTFESKEVQVGDLYQDDTYGELLSAYLPITDSSGELLGIVGADFDASAIYELMQQNRIRAIWIVAAFVAVTSLLTYLFSRYVTKPITELTRNMEKVKEGDLTVSLQLKQKDEVGRLSSSFSQMVGELARMIQVIRRTAEDIHQASRQIGESAGSVSAASVRISGHMKENAAGAEVEASRGHEMDRSMKEVSGGIQRIAGSTAIVAESAQAASAAAEEGEGYLRQVIRQMEEISAYSDRTSGQMTSLTAGAEEVRQIVGVIRRISEQTHLLALNAAIEAARAGEQGRGFAVVADQIRKLAEESQVSVNAISEIAEDIGQGTQSVIEAVQQESREIETGVSIVNSTRDSLGRIRGEIRKVSEQAQEVSAVSQEVAAGSEQVEASVEESAAIALRTTARVQETAKAAEGQAAEMQAIASYAEALRALSGELNEWVDRFNTGERA